MKGNNTIIIIGVRLNQILNCVPVLILIILCSFAANVHTFQISSVGTERLKNSHCGVYNNNNNNFYYYGDSCCLSYYNGDRQLKYDRRKERNKNTRLFCREESLEDSNKHLQQLYKLLGAGPANKLRINVNDEGVRGIFLNQPVEKGDILLRIPLSSCLRDDQPPSWFEAHEGVAWSTRLAASLLDAQYKSTTSSSSSSSSSKSSDSDDNNNIQQGQSIWWDHMLMPQADLLTQSLPVHWNDEQLANTKCRSLDLATDSAYFSRAEALSDLKVLPSSTFFDQHGINNDDLSWNNHCQSALDFVQTRCCGVTLESDQSRLRLLAPIFDLLNHASSEEQGQNAEFLLEKQNHIQEEEEENKMTTIITEEPDDYYLIVRSLCDIQSNNEILISYGSENVKPWKCLLSYGFVPAFHHLHTTAELCINGVWGEVSSGNIPYPLMEQVYHILNKEDPTDSTSTDVQLNADSALFLAKAAKDTILHLEQGMDDEKTSEMMVVDPQKFQAKRLKIHQIRVLKEWSASLEDYANASSV